jgi:hypothetical protein
MPSENRFPWEMRRALDEVDMMAMVPEFLREGWKAGSDSQTSNHLQIPPAAFALWRKDPSRHKAVNISM